MVIKGDIRSLDYSSIQALGTFFCSFREPLPVFPTLLRRLQSLIGATCSLRGRQYVFPL